MSVRPLLALLGAAAFCVPLAGWLGHPVVAYAESASMAPSVRVGDAVLLDPFATDADVGDVILYEAVTRGGALALHRVVARGPEGLVTQGDANARSDQAEGEPPVGPDRIRGRAVERSDGTILVMTGLATPLVAAKESYHAGAAAVGSPFKLLALASLASAFAVLAFSSARRAPTPRSMRRPWSARLFPRGLLVRHAALGVLLVLVGAGAALVFAAHDDAAFSVVVAEHPPAGQSRSARPGDSVARELDVSGYLAFPSLALLEPRGLVEVDATSFALSPGETRRVGVSETAGATVGLQQDEVVVWRYPRVVPDAWTRALHDAAPGAPALLPLAPPLLVLGVWYASLRAGDVPLSRFASSREARG